MAKSLIEALVLQIQSRSRYGLQEWPEGAVSCTQEGDYFVIFRDEDDDDLDDEYNGEYELDNLPKFDEWEGRETVTKAEFDAFVLTHPNLLADYKAAEAASKQRREDINAQIGLLVDELTELCGESNVDVNINLGQHGSLDPASDWDASRC